MTVEYRRGDLFRQQDVQAIGQGVNCKGVMGAGIAVTFRNRWDAMYQEYRALCKRGELKLGDLHAWPAHDEGIWIYNLASQFKPGRNASYDGVRASVTEMLAHMEAHDVSSVALPQIGCGIGGLKWSEVSAIIEELAADRSERIVLVEYAPNA